MNQPMYHPRGSVRLIPAGYDGKLTAPGHENVPVRVFERDRSDLMLVVLLAADSDGLEPDLTEPVMLEYSTERGLVRVQGEATAGERDLIRFHPDEEREVVQRREYVRIDVSQDVRLSDEQGTPLKTQAVDLSGGGMLLRGLEDLEEGARLRFTLEMGAGEPAIEGHARVVRASAGQRGVAFEQISDYEQQRLIRFIFDRQRAALAKTRDGGRHQRRRTA